MYLGIKLRPNLKQNSKFHQQMIKKNAFGIPTQPLCHVMKIDSNFTFLLQATHQDVSTQEEGGR
jgi:hypothetical protein